MPNPIRPGRDVSGRDLAEAFDRLGEPPIGGPGIAVQRQGAMTAIRNTRRDPRPLVQFMARLRDEAPVSIGPNQWRYAWDEVFKVSTGYGGWAIRPNGRSSDNRDLAFHFREDQNDGAGVEGDGVDHTALAANFPGFSMRPAPPNQLVLVTEVTVHISAETTAKEWWFADVNATDGECQ